jgi:hypothetical protein
MEGGIKYVEDWLELEANHWVHNLTYNEWRYAPLPNYVDESTKMMLAGVTCPKYRGFFALAPIKFDEELVSNVNFHDLPDLNWAKVNLFIN